MVDEEDKKDEEKIEFDSAGEAVEYISSDQAQVLARRTARAEPGEYGSFTEFPMAFEVEEESETEDHAANREPSRTTTGRKAIWHIWSVRSSKARTRSMTACTPWASGTEDVLIRDRGPALTN
jgi:hypothetical protein